MDLRGARVVAQLKALLSMAIMLVATITVATPAQAAVPDVLE